MLNSRTVMQLLFATISVLFLVSCHEKEKRPEYYQETPQQILKNETSFINYLSTIDFYDDFKTYDTAGKQIEKITVLKQMADAVGFPVRMMDEDGKMVYKLHAFKKGVAPEIVFFNKHTGGILYSDFNQIGQPIPAMNLPDIEGRMVDLQALKGEVVVLKFWFISCVPCVAEFPYVNTLVAKYPKVRFISIATDKKGALINFLKDKQLDYNVVPGGGDFAGTMKVSGYPTHIVIDREGKIVSFTNNPHKMVPVLDRLTKG